MANKTALITGATGGLGMEFVKLHAKNGDNLVLVGRNPQKLAQLEETITQRYQVDVLTIAVDFAQFDAAEQIFAKLQETKTTKIDYLINNAGLGGLGTFIERTSEQDINMATVNMITPTKLLKLILPQMVEREQGHILNVSSAAALIPGPLQAEYFATKAYLTSLSNALWYELKDTGVTVTALMPGAMDTGFIEAGGLTGTKIFANAGSPKKVAAKAYQAMLAGKLNVFAGFSNWQTPFVGMMPLVPKKQMMSFIADIQSKDQPK
ncbi:oxidoreductase, short chain dehydrogenase reductase family protein [Ligilactobacillus apodemi DSM 16634 = JCM 16172]|uniref:Oxidoreductase, short chain dehydrogenase reductase family protein n=3 Tax=Ligilactobacillus TaxID=2767887 RepID=A0A0R1U1Z9_9LACO|nr:SDR family oxidoreductase [Ligilactobacillus apodemi]KRL87388.1 oxidoreductase, short chain dehydrogenase reductase family protein [Ligilactobacillus apodemi DSM 16634 = JCM 16172]